MDRKELTLDLERRTARIWGELCELRPRLVRFDQPKIILDSRFWRVAGQCHQDQNKIRIALNFFRFVEFRATMRAVILPHEIIHQADYNLYGESEKICGHGENWQKLMVEYGLPANKYHSMEIKRK
jgi:predicted SprT family Zn-dependent metalloprotease